MCTDLYHDVAVLLDINHVCKQFKAPLFGSFRDNPHISQFTDLTPRSLGSTIVQSTWRQCTVCFLKVCQKIWPQFESYAEWPCFFGHCLLIFTGLTIWYQAVCFDVCHCIKTYCTYTLTVFIYIFMSYIQSIWRHGFEWFKQILFLTHQQIKNHNQIVQGAFMYLRTCLCHVTSFFWCLTVWPIHSKYSHHWFDVNCQCLKSDRKNRDSGTKLCQWL